MLSTGGPGQNGATSLAQVTAAVETMNSTQTMFEVLEAEGEALRTAQTHLLAIPPSHRTAVLLAVRRAHDTFAQVAKHAPPRQNTLRQLRGVHLGESELCLLVSTYLLCLLEFIGVSE
ncbi:hypothetical protein HDU98_004430 [Podochytrium sp. JEL0797]|nr:hypothetical protein HDU98_004430 [Podochytrium sp. JEL0797]